MSEPVTDLSGQLLIAMPALKDVNFAHSVIYLCEHNRDGAIGIVINRPSGIELSELFAQLDITCENSSAAQPLFFGGPVQTDRGFILHDGEHLWQSTMRMADNIGVITSLDILEAMAHGEGPPKSLVALGYAGWGEGQLEQELADNAWLSAPAQKEILFDIPAKQRWQAAADVLGVDLNLLSAQSGHA
ncbi:MAG: YqgE/AlgH family protein [gamma proteobacterium symbiont of Bathyaustriella thionipta]|nr:YqgE/AlgH family protein [gamma proteobacterium symbiont of Bathyaustriella thionipta]